MMVNHHHRALSTHSGDGGVGGWYLFVMGTFKERHLDGNYCTGAAAVLRGFTVETTTVTQYSVNV